MEHIYGLTQPLANLQESSWYIQCSSLLRPWEMWPIRCLIVSTLLMAVAALPARPKKVTKAPYKLNPTTWHHYLETPPYPTYDPPDLGPREIDNEFFDDFPGVAKRQQIYQRQKYTRMHDTHVSCPFFLPPLSLIEGLGCRFEGMNIAC